MEKNEIRKLFELGNKLEATHLIIFYDTHDDKYLPEYVNKGQTVDEVLNIILKHGGIFKVEGIFNYDLDLEEQLKEKYPCHNEPSKKYKTNYELALEFAKEKHKGQYRKGKIEKEYIEHPIEVAKYVDIYLNDYIGKETYKVVALLHDTIEDTDTTYYDIYSIFGEKVADMVRSLTSDDDEITKYGKDVYLANKLTKMSNIALTIKLCDRLCNIKDLIITDNENFKKKYMNETMYILNYLLMNRELEDIHLRIINDIMVEIKNISNKSHLEVAPNKKALKLK